VEEEALRTHLDSCEMCRAAFALDLAIIDALRTSPNEAFESVAGEVMERVGAKERRFATLRWGVVAAALCSVAFVVNSLGAGVRDYVLGLVSGDVAVRPEITALGKIASLVVELMRSLGSLVVEGVAGGGASAYLPYILAVVISGCLFVMFIMYMLGLWLRKPGEVRS
jgi:hypothetical protein